MPVRFRCVYCNQLLGIAKRKAGSIVRCTNCDGKIIVPQPEEIPTMTASSGPKDKGDTREQVSHLFERHDFDDLLRPIQESQENDFQFAQTAISHSSPVSKDSDTARFRALRQAGSPSSLFADRPWLVIVSALALALIFFAVGFLVARLVA
ncbi:MAG: hypothetical protein ACJ8C4_16755 [Gemmataceae bacterium]